MEETQVVIIGGGPSGLALGLSLAQYKVKSVILEREEGIISDPRGVWLTGDAVRICYSLGLGPDMPSIGHASLDANFHQTYFKNPPFFQIPFGTANNLEHALPEGYQISQPTLETVLRRKIEESPFCTLWPGCNVTGRSSEDPPVVEYTTTTGKKKSIQGQFLVGADGKTGIVRKHFLEPTAGIKQESGVYPYEGVWVASNIRITLPTPETHPKFPLWNLGYSPEEVYDLFWPAGWHFCAPPGKATATGRFGPRADRTWRHEFIVENESSGPIYSEELFWEHLLPNVTRDHDPANGRNFGSPVEFPRDCIEILRCRPFKFVHKCVNRWFHQRTMLIGDAAHVFPPFAGQGIASGLRDAHQLAWRLAILLQEQSSIDGRLGLLDAWALERRQSVDAAALMSKISGFAVNNEPTWWVFLVTKLVKFLEQNLPSLWRQVDIFRVIEVDGFSKVPGGFHMKSHRGGIRVAQIHLKDGQGTFLSDDLFCNRETVFTILVVGNQDAAATIKWKEEAQAAVKEVCLDPKALSSGSVVLYIPASSKNTVTVQISGCPDANIPAPVSEISSPLAKAYSSGSFMDRLGNSTRFAIIRPDLFTFACVKNVSELKFCLAEMKKMLRQ